jgi:hypothetical protein
MEKEYTISIGWKIFMITVAVFLIGFSIFLLSLGTGRNNNDLIFLMPLTIFIGGVWIIIQQIKSKIIITDTEITRVNAFSAKEIAINDIKGCRVGSKVIVIVSSNPNSSNITINNYDVLRNSDELAKYFRETFKNQDSVDLENEHAKALQDTKLGVTEGERENALKKAKYVSWSYNIIGVVIGLTMLFDDAKPSVIMFLLYPLLGILMMVFSKGLIKFLSNNKRSVYGFTMLGIFLPSIFLLFKSLFEYTTINNDHLWLPFLFISAILFILLYITGINTSVSSIKGQAVIMLIVSLIYALGATRQINCVFDDSQPKLVHTTVDSKWIEHNKGSHYHLKLVSWTSDQKPQDIEVSHSTYDQYSDGNNIDVNVKNGLLNIPWFYLDL